VMRAGAGGKEEAWREGVWESVYTKKGACGGKRVQRLTGSESVKSVKMWRGVESLESLEARVCTGEGRLGAGKSGGGEDLGPTCPRASAQGTTR